MSNQIAEPIGSPPLRVPRSEKSLPGRRYRGWLRLALLVLCTGLCTWLLPATVLAQDYAAAGQHFDAAQEAFQKGDFKRAAQQYQAAYAITKDPALLFSIGESFQRAGEPQRALDSYRAYLREQPSTSDRPEVEKRIRALEEALAPPPNPGQAGTTPPSPGATPAQGGQPGPATAGTPPAGSSTPGSPGTDPSPAAAGQTGSTPTGPSPGAETKPEMKTEGKPETKTETKTDPVAQPVVVMPPGEKPTALRTAAWVGTAAAVALGTAGAIVGLGAQNRADELRRRTTLLVGNLPPVYDASQAEAYTTLMSEGQSYNAASIGLLTAAGVATVVSAVLFIVDFRMLAKKSATRTATISAAPGVALRAPTLSGPASGQTVSAARPLSLLAGSF